MMLLPLLLLATALLAVRVVAQPSVTTVHVSLSGADTAGCGTLPDADACLSLRFALTQVPIAGATILLADGTYTGVNNTNIELRPTPPLHIKAAHTGRVIIDAESVSQRRHFTLLLGTNSSVLPPSSSRIDIEGLTLRNGRALMAGSILIRGDAINIGATVGITDCVFEQNMGQVGVYNPIGPMPETLVTAGAVFVWSAVLPGSLQSAQNQPAMIPPGRAADPKLVGMAPGAPESPYASSAWTDTPPLPQLEEDGGTFRPAVIFRRCEFVKNTIFDEYLNYMSSVVSAASVALDTSVVAMLDCTFRDHAPPALHVLMLSGRGDTWLHGCVFQDANVGSISVSAFEMYFSMEGMEHNLVVSQSHFNGLVAHPVTPYMVDLMGKQVGAALMQFGGGCVTFIDTHVVGTKGTAIVVGARGIFRMHGGSIAQSVSLVDSLINMPAPTSLLFSRTTFSENGQQQQHSHFSQPMPLFLLDSVSHCSLLAVFYLSLSVDSQWATVAA